MGELSRGLLDTSVLIALGEDPRFADGLPDELSISVATVAELHFGVLLAKDEFTRQLRLRRLGAIEAAFQPIGIDAAVARSFASLAHAVRQCGRNPRSRVMDLWIAATAMSQQLRLYTRNADDFAGLEALVEVRAV